MARSTICDDIEYKRPDFKTGLSFLEVEERIKAKLTNKTNRTIGKTIPQILVTNLLTFFNLLLLAIAVIFILFQQFTSLFFYGICLLNMTIGLIQDFRAHHLLSKLRLLNEPNVNVIRESKLHSINIDDVVRDDIILLKSGNQIVADGEILEGEIAVNESLLTGESLNIYKKKGDKVFSGTSVISGTAYQLVEAVGNDNYAISLQENARKQKRKKSELKNNLDNLFKFIGIVVICGIIMTFVVVITKFYNNGFEESEHKKTILNLAGMLVAMIPAGLYLLTSITLTVGVINLSKKKTLVQDFYSLEMLARTTTLCLDKTGTITDGSLEVIRLENFSNSSEYEIKLLISNLIHATKDENITARAIKEAYPYALTEKVISFLPFDSANKYSSATFSNGTFVLGALEVLNTSSKVFYEEKASSYLKKGYRLLAFGKCEGIKNNKIVGETKIIAFIVLKDHIREEAVSTFKWFEDNKVKIRVISGDNAMAVSEICKEAGIKDADKYISLENISNEQLKEVAVDYTVFGRVSPEQKSLLVDIFKEHKEVVGMVGDGVNDILALRKADCSIAMVGGTEAARNVSHLVLLDNNFSSMPSIVAEGRRVINNVSRTCSLFLSKTFFAIIMGLLFFITTFTHGINYPFQTNHLYLWEITAIGIGAFLVSIEPNKEPIKGKFIKSILYYAISGGLLMSLSVGCVFFFSLVKVFNKTLDINIAINISAIMMGILPLFIFGKVCYPFSKYRRAIFILISSINILALVVSGVLSYTIHVNEPFRIDFNSMNSFSYFILAFISAIFSSIYFFVLAILDEIHKKRSTKEKDENK